MKCYHNPWRTATSLSAKLKQLAIFRKVPSSRWVDDYWSGLTVQVFAAIAPNSRNAAVETWVVSHCRTNTNQNTIVT
jgi:hypothetical protein